MNPEQWPTFVVVYDSRPTWHAYFLTIAEAVATRADCTRRRVGAVIASRDHRIMATGYNGAPPRGPSCLKGECPRGRMSFEEVPHLSSYDTGAGSCVALHAEQNAIMYASLEQRRGSTIYVTELPCDGCFRMLQGSGLDQVVYPHAESGRPFLQSLAMSHRGL